MEQCKINQIKLNLIKSKDECKVLHKVSGRNNLINEDLLGALGFPCDSAGKESACNVEDLGPIPGFTRSLGEGLGKPLQYSGLENSMDYIVHGVTKSQT